MKRILQVYFVLVILVLCWASAYATYGGFTGPMKNVFIGYRETWAQPWGMATLFDAYFGFVVFYLWLAYKETAALARVLWFILIMLGGNLAISSYMLIQLSRLKDGEKLETLLLRKKA